jgi:hypothetical protein
MKAIFPFCFFLLALPCFLRAQDPDIEANERSVLEDIYRSSDHDTEMPTARRGKHNKRQTVPTGAFRLGCTCMDDSYSPTHASGACSGHGGVRFWHYRTPEGDTVRVMTARHERHPQPLNAEEMSEVNQKRAKRTANLPTVANPLGLSPAPLQPIIINPAEHSGGYFDWSDAAAISAIGLSLFFIVRMLLLWMDKNPEMAKYALRNLLRHRKRPPARKSRKTPGAPRM